MRRRATSNSKFKQKTSGDEIFVKNVRMHDTRPFTPFSAPFLSFWQAGYEGADHINRMQHPLSMNQVTGHLDRAYEDYQRLAEFGIRTVRESVGWRLVEKDGQFDFSSLEERARAAQELGLQICWTFCHYGWPSDIDVFAPQFVERFRRFCSAVTQFLAPYSEPAPIYSPINEISFASWGLSSHTFHCKNMYHEHAGYEGKRQLVRATIAGCEAIWEVNPNARFLHCDPLIHVIAPIDRPDWAAQAASWRESQFEAWDMLCGRRAPELGGDPRYLDLIGANYYHSNQWESGTNLRLWWHLDNPHRMPLHQLLVKLYQRYQRPVLLAETSHVGSGRGLWIREIAEETALAMQRGVDFRGIGIYPVIDRPDWEDENFWHHSGLWDVDLDGPDKLARILPPIYAKALRQAQRLTQNLCSTTASAHGREGIKMQTIIVFCHLRWDFVYQRPQQLLSRLAQHYRIIFIEEPVYSEGKSFLKKSIPAPNVTVCQPHTPVAAVGFHDDQIPLLKPLLADLMPEGEDPIVWFYTPMALPLLQQLHPDLVVYDCMDELAAFKNSPKQLLQRESALFNIADLVFAGGPSLYQAKRQRHANAHCFPSSVDIVHFAQALDRNNAHPAHMEIPQPRLGFYGVIDERFDTALIEALADANSHWQIVLVGPIVKIDAASLPQRSNIHYLGQQPYKALPHFLAGWDVCLLPFALNEATRFISPTKILEYMAAELPIVSTAIADVAGPYGEYRRRRAMTSRNSSAACEAALTATPEQRAEQAARMQAIVSATSWEATADKMRALLEAAARAPENGASAGHRTAPITTDVTLSSEVHLKGGLKVNPLRQTSMPRAKCVIIGAGPTGLSAAYHLGSGHAVIGKKCDCRRLVPLHPGPGFYLRPCWPHHVFQRSLCAEAVRRLARQKPALAEPRSMGLQQECLYTISIPGGAVRLAAASHQGMHHGRNRSALRQLESSFQRSRKCAALRSSKTGRGLLRRRQRNARRNQRRKAKRRRGISRNSFTRYGGAVSPSTLRFLTTKSCGPCR